MLHFKLRSCLPDLSEAQRSGLIRTALGALIGILLTGLLSELVAAQSHAMMRLLLIAPMGAAAVLLFAVPTSPLAQPWPVIGGNCISALVGVLCLGWIGYSLTGAAVAVGSAIAAMILLRCLHPPGGAAALSAVLGGPMLGAHPYAFVWEVALNAGLLLIAAYLYNNLTGRPYPHRAHSTPAQPPVMLAEVQPADIEAALPHFGPIIDRGDLDRLYRLASAYAYGRRLGAATCQEIMAAPVAVAGPHMTVREARKRMRSARQAVLPIVDEHYRVQGIVTSSGITPGSRADNSRLGKLMPDAVSAIITGGRTLDQLLQSTSTARPHTRLSEVAPHLLDGSMLAVPVVNEHGQLVGMITRDHLIEACRTRQAAQTAHGSRMALSWQPDRGREACEERSGEARR